MNDRTEVEELEAELAGAEARIEELEAENSSIREAMDGWAKFRSRLAAIDMGTIRLLREAGIEPESLHDGVKELLEKWRSAETEAAKLTSIVSDAYQAFDGTSYEGTLAERIRDLLQSHHAAIKTLQDELREAHDLLVHASQRAAAAELVRDEAKRAVYRLRERNRKLYEQLADLELQMRSQRRSWLRGAACAAREAVRLMSGRASR